MKQARLFSLDRPSDRPDRLQNYSDFLSEEESEAEDSHTAPGGWIILRVGGQAFETSKQTLCADRGSMLAAWVLRHRNNEDENSNSALRIDRDGHRFRHVLNYLRNGTVWLEDAASLRELLEEAEYFCLSGLQALCEDRIRRIEEAEETMWKRSVQALQEQVKNSFGSFDKFRAGCGNGEVYAILRGRRLGCREEELPEFRLDVDF